MAKASKTQKLITTLLFLLVLLVIGIFMKVELSLNDKAVTRNQSAGRGEELVKQVCAACHIAGVANAPKLGDKAGWMPSLERGLPEMLTAVIAGKGAMPPRGGAPEATDIELTHAIIYMANLAGGNLKEPPEEQANSVQWSNSTIQSAYYAIHNEEIVAPTRYSYGAIAPYKDTFLFSDAFSLIYIFRNGVLKRIPGKTIPDNRAAFIAKYPELEHGFTVKDMVLIGHNYILLSGFRYDIKNDCHTITLFKAPFSEQQIGEWTRLFNSSPCLKLIRGFTQENPGNSWNTISAGGNMQLMGGGRATLRRLFRERRNGTASRFGAEPDSLLWQDNHDQRYRWFKGDFHDRS